MGGGSNPAACLSVVAETESPTLFSQDSRELLRAASEFDSVDAALERLMEGDTDPPDSELLMLHRRWSAACQLCSDLKAHTSTGRRAKAKVLLRAIQVARGNNFEGALPHELLAFSLAQDLVLRGDTDENCSP